MVTDITIMRHKHHIVQRYKGGDNSPSNLVELSATCHSMWHWCEWKLWGDYRDYCAHKMILGDVNNPEFRSSRGKAFGSINGRKGGKRTHELHPNHASNNNKKQRDTLSKLGRTIAEQEWEIVTPNGEELIISNLAKYCRENGLDKSKMCLVSKGKYRQHKGYTCKKLEAIVTYKPKKYYHITYPNGEEIEVTHLTDWCKLNDINPTMMFRVVCGHRKTHKGYKVKKSIR